MKNLNQLKKSVSYFLSISLALSILSCSTSTPGTQNEDKKSETTVEKVSDVNSEVDASKGCSALNLDDCIDDVVDSVEDFGKTVVKFTDNIDDIAKEVNDEIYDTWKLVKSEIEKVIDFVTDYMCNKFADKSTSIIRKVFPIAATPIETCLPTKDGGGYFLFGETGGANDTLPFNRFTVYLSLSSGKKEIRSKLLTDSPIDVEAALGDDNSEVLDAALNKVGLDLQSTFDSLTEKLGKFAVIFAYNPREGVSIYIQHNTDIDVENDSVVGPILKKLKLYAKLTGSLNKLKFGEIIEQEHKGGSLNPTVLLYVFGTHQVKFNKIN